jgi:FkbM family methyltransferase
MDLALRVVRRVANIIDPIDAFLHQAKGVIHVGANDGWEREEYHRCGLEVLWVEAIPLVFEKLSRKIKPYPLQRAVSALLTDRTGETYKFNVYDNDGQSSSILELKPHKEDIWPEVFYDGQIDPKSTTLDAIVNDVEKYDALVIDTQGSELLALKGGERVLRHIKWAKVKATDFEAYEGCATVRSLSEYLMNRGFRLKRKDKFATRRGGGAYFDLLFVRQAWCATAERSACRRFRFARPSFNTGDWQLARPAGRRGGTWGPLGGAAQSAR